MHLVRFTLALFCLCGPRAVTASEDLSLVLQTGTSTVLRHPGVRRLALGTKRVASVRAIGSNEVLVTGKKAGITSLRVWHDGGMTSYFVRTLAPEAAGAAESERVVAVELEFLEMDATRMADLGIDWPDAIRADARGVTQLTGEGSGLNVSAAFDSTDALLRAMVREGWARRLARPRLRVRLGEEAEFHSGGEFPFESHQSARYRRARIAWKPFGITVRVRPSSLDGIRFSSEIFVEVSEVAASLGTDDVPGLNTRRLHTKIFSAHGETVVLSGLVRQVSENADSGLPLLRDIPVLGTAVFGARHDEHRRSEMLLAMTLSTLHRSADARALERLRGSFPEDARE